MIEGGYREYLPIPDDKGLLDAAKSKPGGWVYDIDWAYKDDQPVPAEAIRGGWEVDQSGNPTGQFDRNTRYRPVEHSTRILKKYKHLGARTNRDQWNVEIDPRGELLFPAISKDLNQGQLYVDKDGKITNNFRPNSQWIGHDGSI